MSHPRFMPHPHFIIRILPQSVFSYPCLISHPQFLTVRIRVLSLYPKYSVYLGLYLDFPQVRFLYFPVVFSTEGRGGRKGRRGKLFPRFVIITQYSSKKMPPKKSTWGKSRLYPVTVLHTPVPATIAEKFRHFLC